MSASLPGPCCIKGRAGGGNKESKGHCTGKARAMAEMGGSGEEKAILERSVGDGGIQSELDHQSYLRWSAISQKSFCQWYGADTSYSYFPSPWALKNILIGCQTSLSQGQYTWCHNQVLQGLTGVLDPWPSFIPSADKRICLGRRGSSWMGHFRTRHQAAGWCTRL